MTLMGFKAPLVQTILLRDDDPSSFMEALLGHYLLTYIRLLMGFIVG